MKDKNMGFIENNTILVTFLQDFWTAGMDISYLFGLLAWILITFL